MGKKRGDQGREKETLGKQNESQLWLEVASKNKSKWALERVKVKWQGQIKGEKVKREEGLRKKERTLQEEEQRKG